MKKAVVILVLLVVLTLAFSSVAYAAGHLPEVGLPGAHGVDGPTFGGVVSAKAQCCPLWLAEHVAGCYVP